MGGLGMGATLSTKVDDALRSQVKEQLAQKEQRAVVAPKPKVSLAKAPSPGERYWALVAADAKRFGVRAPSKKRQRATQSHRRWLKKAKTLKVGKRLRKGPLELKVLTQSVRFRQQGTLVKSRHTVLRVRNRGGRPLAYRVLAKAARRRCKVRGTREHNAVAILPKQSVDITICAGKSAVKVQGVETLELSRLGYHYISQVPPEALGVDAMRASAHRVPKNGRVCGSLQNGHLGKALREGGARWVDIADFYSRHSCAAFSMPEGYRKPRRRLKSLPLASLPASP